MAKTIFGEFNVCPIWLLHIITDCMLIAHMGHTVITHVMTFSVGQPSPGIFEPITVVVKNDCSSIVSSFQPISHISDQRHLTVSQERRRDELILCRLRIGHTCTYLTHRHLLRGDPQEH